MAAIKAMLPSSFALAQPGERASRKFFSFTGTGEHELGFCQSKMGQGYIFLQEVLEMGEF